MLISHLLSFFSASLFLRLPIPPYRHPNLTHPYFNPNLSVCLSLSVCLLYLRLLTAYQSYLYIFIFISASIFLSYTLSTYLQHQLSPYLKRFKTAISTYISITIHISLYTCLHQPSRHLHQSIPISSYISTNYLYVLSVPYIHPCLY